MIRWPLSVLPVALSILLAGTIGGVPQEAAPGRTPLSMVNGAPFKSGLCPGVDNAHCGWAYALGGGAFYAATVPGDVRFPARLHDRHHQHRRCSLARGKSIQVAGFPDHFVLWPGQSGRTYHSFDSAWVKTVDPGRWRQNRGKAVIPFYYANTDFN